MKRILLIGLMCFLFYPIGINAQVLNVKKVTQEYDQWCWAGVSSCILDFYGHPVSQCSIAEYSRTVITWGSYGSTNCCVNANAGCNYWNYNYGNAGSIQDILTHFANISNTGLGRTLSLTEIQTQIGQYRPFVVRWGWTTGGGHFVLGYGISGNNIYYMNPWPGEGLKIGTYTWLTNDGSHTWTHTNQLNVSATTIDAPMPLIARDSICMNQATVFSVTPLAGATYNWKIDGINQAETTSSISKTFSAAGNKLITVRAIMGGDSGRILNINTFVKSVSLVKPVAVFHDDTICENNIASFRVANTANLVFRWKINGEIQADSTSFINVKLSKPFNNTIAVFTYNNCGNSQDSLVYSTYVPNPDKAVINSNTNQTELSTQAVGNYYNWYLNNQLLNSHISKVQPTQSGNYQVSYFTTLHNCESALSDAFAFVKTGLTEQSMQNKFLVYPNPGNGLFYVEPTTEATINVYSISGQMVYEQNLASGSAIDLRHLQNGLYFMHIQMNEQKEIHKIVLVK